MSSRKEEIVASVTLVEALRRLLDADAPEDKTKQVTEPIRIVRVADSI